jgi:hypothetical protein
MAVVFYDKLETAIKLVRLGGFARIRGDGCPRSDGREQKRCY